MGYNPEVILAGRRINDRMGSYIAQQTIRQMLKADRLRAGATVLVMGLTFKENCADIRNSKVIDIIQELRDHGLEVVVWDPVAEPHEAQEEYDIRLVADWQSLPRIDAVVAAVAHQVVREIPPGRIVAVAGQGTPVIDVKSVFNRQAFAEAGLPSGVSESFISEMPRWCGGEESSLRDCLINCQCFRAHPVQPECIYRLRAPSG